MPETLRGVEVFAAGTWNEMKFVTTDLEEIARNTNSLIAANRQHPALKLGHSETEYGADGQPALGWVENLRVSGEKLLADFVGVPDQLVSAVRQTLYRQVSAELDYLREFGWLLRGVAILGADLPAVKTLADLQTYLSDKPPPTGDAPLVFSAAAPYAPRVSRVENRPMPDPKLIPAAGDSEEVKQLKAQLAAQNQQLATFAESQRELKFTAARDDLLKPLKAAVDAGSLEPVLYAEAEKELATQAKTFADDRPLAFSAALTLRFATSARRPGGAGALDDEPGGDAEPADVTLANAAAAYQAEHPAATFAEVRRAVFAKHPQLARRYTREEGGHTVHDARPPRAPAARLE